MKPFTPSFFVSTAWILPMLLNQMTLHGLD